MTTDAEILFETRNRVGIITLNRPRALNALNTDMVAQMHPQLVAWAKDPSIAAVVVRAAGEKAFCAGGDIRQLHDLGKADDPAAGRFYRNEYRLNTFIKRYPKPYIALINGIVMGGGVGISVHGSHRVISETLMFAMPETGIGFFPDVGGTYFLPRMPGKVGTFLALTASRLNQADALWAGFATSTAPAAAFDAITDRLAETGDVEAALAVSSAPAAPRDEPSLPALLPVINRCFSAATIEEILARLDAETGEHAAWAAKQAATMRQKSPTSLKIALRQMQLGATAEFEECMAIEYRIVSRIFHGSDFFEGVRAVIIDKDNAPKWQPAALETVSDADIDAYFAPLADELDLRNLDAA